MPGADRHGGVPTLLQRQAFWAPLLVGTAVMAAVDEIVFHQILGWHHFYDLSTTQLGILSDGVLHAAELFLLVAGFFLIADCVRKRAFAWLSAWAGFLIGAGAFQLWDGIVHHKLLGVHQVRYGVELLPYDIAWNASGLVFLVAGLMLALRAARQPRRSA